MSLAIACGMSPRSEYFVTLICLKQGLNFLCVHDSQDRAFRGVYSTPRIQRLLDWPVGCTSLPGLTLVIGINLIRSLRCGSCRNGWAHLWEKSIQSPYICLSSVRSASLLVGPNSCWQDFGLALILARSCCVCSELPIDSAGSCVGFQLATIQRSLFVWRMYSSSGNGL